MKGYGCEEKYIRHYTCYRAPLPAKINGKLEESCWQCAPKSPRFVDLVTGVPGILNPRVASLWDDNNLYKGVLQYSEKVGKP